MPSTYRALCSDFYINTKLSVRMELPTNREPVLELFERTRRSYPEMSAFRRYKEELALESAPNASPHRWLAIRSASVRAGVVNPETAEDMYSIHRTACEISPYFLSISPLDIEYIELLYGFDLAAKGNHDAITANALFAGSPIAALLDTEAINVLDCQPSMGMKLIDDQGLECHFEVKTRSKGKKSSEANPDPISVYLTLRKYDPVKNLEELTPKLDEMIERGQNIVDQYALPNLLMPIREEIASGSF